MPHFGDVRSGLKTLMVALDGVTQESYEKYRKGGRLDWAFANVRAIADAKKRLGLTTPYLRWQWLTFAHNVHEVERGIEVAKEVGAYFVVDMAHIAGLVATGDHPSPIPYADVVTTTTHKTLRGPRAGLILSKAEHAKAIDKAVFPGTQGGPLEHVIAAKAVAFKEALEPSFKLYSQQVVKNAKVLASGLMERGYHIVSGGTDNHLMLVDLRSKSTELTGKVAEKALDLAGITVNKNTVPKETQSPFVTSGIRIGSPAVTTRGFKEQEMRTVAGLIDRVLSAPADEAVARAVRADVRELTSTFPLYPVVEGARH